MSSYFDQVEQMMGDVVQRLAHRSWHVRLRHRIRRHSAPAVVIAALVIAAPAVSAVTHWYGLGPSNHPQSEAQAFGVGHAIRGTARLLALRVPDPQGGPPWGIHQIVRTQHGSCQEFGRVENGQLGSLGIDDYWNNDHLFHPFPKDLDRTVVWKRWWRSRSWHLRRKREHPQISQRHPNRWLRDSFNRSYGTGTVPTGKPAACDGDIPWTARKEHYLPHTKRVAAHAAEPWKWDIPARVPLNATTCRVYLRGQLTNDGACQRNILPEPRQAEHTLIGSSQINQPERREVLPGPPA